MNYITVNVFCEEPFSEILIAELSEISFDPFLETPEGFQACIDKETFDKKALDDIFDRYRAKSSLLDYEIQEVEKKNWNEEWEKNYAPIVVSDKCIVRASFHKPEKPFQYEIIINPKMSFGTGHHETTFLMLSNQMELDHKGKNVLDIGCGTGILAIMAQKLGAKSVQAYDIDDWSIENSLENFSLNDCSSIGCHQGNIANLPSPGKQDIILANINRNVLLDEIPLYSQLLKEGGHLLLSGFYRNDIPDITKIAESNGLKKLREETKKDWAVVLCQKSMARS